MSTDVHVAGQLHCHTDAAAATAGARTTMTTAITIQLTSTTVTAASMSTAAPAPAAAASPTPRRNDAHRSVIVYGLVRVADDTGGRRRCLWRQLVVCLYGLLLVDAVGGASSRGSAETKDIRGKSVFAALACSVVLCVTMGWKMGTGYIRLWAEFELFSARRSVSRLIVLLTGHV